MSDYDIIIKNGFVVDGTGRPGRHADVAVKGDSIAFIGDCGDACADRIIDAAGHLVCPGFIDPHTHEETVALWDGDFEVYLKMGVTTTINGNCSHSITPLSSRNVYQYYYKNGLMTAEGVEKFNAFQPSWNDFAGFCGILEEKGVNINMGFLLGHGTIRWTVMGGSKDRKPTPEENSQIHRFIEEGLSQGALGLSTGLAYIPSRFADTDEIVDCCRIVKKYNGTYATHGRYYIGILPSTEEAIQIGRRSGARVQVSHLTPTSPESYDAILNARREGIQIAADVVPRSAGHCMRKDRLIQFIMAVSATLFDMGVEGVKKALSDPEGRRVVRKEAYILGTDMTAMRLINTGIPAFENKSVQEIADHMGRGDDAFDVLLDLIGDERQYTFWLGGPVRADYPLTPHPRNILENPYVMAGSDRIFAEPWDPMSWYELQRRGSFPIFMEMYRKKGISVEEIVRRNTTLAAEQFAIADRGRLAPGMKADISVIDLDRYSYPSPFEIDYSNASETAAGVEYVLVNGKVTLDQGQVLKTRAGQIVRRGD